MHMPRIAPQPQRPKSRRTRWVIGLALLVLIGVGAAQESHRQSRMPDAPTQPATTNVLDLEPGPAGRLASDERTLATNKLAEMVALFRHSEDCPEVPRAWSTALILLESVNPLIEDQIKTKRDRDACPPDHNRR